jgi:hypothetical protein
MLDSAPTDFKEVGAARDGRLFSGARKLRMKSRAMSFEIQELDTGQRAPTPR